jgi:hypothetical protein
MRKATAGVVFGAMGIVAAAVGVLAPGCGGGSASCTVGSEGCPCTGGGACDNGLTCASNKCVNLGTVNPDGGGAGTGGTAASACDTFTAYCAKINQCAPALVKISYGTVDECNARFKLSCVDATGAPGSGLTAATISACSTALSGAACTDVIYRKVTACNIAGTRANGMACGTDSQCTTGYCAQSNQACGVCSALVGAGNACMVDDDCQAGLVCNSANVCVLPGGAGGNCSDSQPCAYGLFCLVTAGSTTGACATDAETPGGTCNPTLAESCDILKGIYCDGTVSTCKNLGFASPGDNCGLVSGQYVLCSTGQCIYPTVDATEGTCRAQAADGAACDATTTCESPARCVSGHCALPSSSACL